jgi:hypothetical protein
LKKLPNCFILIFLGVDTLCTNDRKVSIPDKPPQFNISKGRNSFEKSVHP